MQGNNIILFTNVLHIFNIQHYSLPQPFIFFTNSLLKVVIFLKFRRKFFKFSSVKVRKQKYYSKEDKFSFYFNYYNKFLINAKYK